MKHSLFKKILTLGFLFFVSPITTLADTTNTPPGFIKAQDNLNTLQNVAIGNSDPQTPQEIIARIIGIALGLIGIIFVILMIYGGYLWMTARGNEDQVSKSRELIIQSIIGAVIVFLAYFITAFVIQRVGESVFEPIFY